MEYREGKEEVGVAEVGVGGGGVAPRVERL